MAEMNDALVPEPPVDNWDEIPEQGKARVPALPVGTYEFQIPANLQPKHWEKQEKEVKVVKEGLETTEKVVTGYRVRFDADLPLVVTRDTTPEQTYASSGSIFGGSISTMPRPRFGKKGDPPKHVSDAVYLYKDGLKGAVGGFKPTEHEKLIAAICQVGAGKKFIADVAWPAYCNKKKVRRVRDSAGQLIDDPEGKFGCGKNFRTATQEEFPCECGAAIFVFPELVRYRVSEEKQ
jgi:hypothetical protein